MIILDTDVLIEIFDKKSSKGDEALDRIEKSGEDIAITSIGLHEILYGLNRYGDAINEVTRLPVLPFTRKDAMVSAKLELDMKRKGTSMRRTDAMIAAVAINNGGKLYTFDLKHFGPLEEQGIVLFR